MLSELVGQYFRISLSTSVVIAALLLFLPLLRRRYAAKWRYAIWMLLAVRLLLPFSVTLPEQPVQIPIPVNAAAVVEFEDHRNESEAEERATVQYIAPSGTGISVSPVVAVWLLGASVSLLLQFLLYLRFHRSLRQSAPRPASERITLLFEQLAEGKHAPDILVCAAVSSPVLCGFLRTKLYLPHEQYGDDEIRLILHHELVHYRRRDLFCKLLLLAVGCLHWFNPLVHILVNEAGREMEFSCDDEVTRHMDRQGRAAYGSVILATLPRTRSGATPLFTTGFNGNKITLKRRLRNLFDFHAKCRGIPTLVAVVMAAVVLTGTIAFLPISAADRLPSPGGKTVAVSIPQITPDQPELIGRFELDGSNLVVTLQGNGGTGIGIGVSKNPDLTFPQTEPWERYVEGTGSSSVRASFVDLQGICYVYAVSESDPFYNVTGQVQTTKAVTGIDDTERQFLRFASCGIIYDAAQDTATYGGERVTLFVVRRMDGSFDLCWYDRSSSAGSLIVEGIQNTNGEATDIRTLEMGEARELLAGLYGAYEPGDRGAGIQPVPYVFGGTQLGPDGFTASDLTKDSVPEEVRLWMEACDQQGGGAYVWQRQPDALYDTYVYYNLGGRYPWIVEFEGDGLAVKLYDNNGRVTDDGYYLMRYRSDIHVRNVTLLLDGEELSFTVTAV